ncbi:hypothetical protein DICVIV_12595 [Dictyocaulus viviparus]|uniref:Uncharacterized protein n=1 Tax=Dictyocaulus viviparus TaxID=29172 RepID=A0A0D8XCQ2_DICVI|nr:hypothetical protein DICVIV_12595 [Dictyocaulus viviparus]
MYYSLVKHVFRYIFRSDVLFLFCFSTKHNFLLRKLFIIYLIPGYRAGYRRDKSGILKRAHVAEESLPFTIDHNEVAHIHAAKLQKMATVGQAALAARTSTSASTITTPNSMCSTPVSLFPQPKIYHYVPTNSFSNQFCEVRLSFLHANTDISLHLR